MSKPLRKSVPVPVISDVVVPDYEEMTEEIHSWEMEVEDDFRFPDLNNVIQVEFSQAAVSAAELDTADNNLPSVKTKPLLKIYLSSAAAAFIMLSLLSTMLATSSQASKSAVVALNSTATAVVESKEEVSKEPSTPATVAATLGLRFSVAGEQDRLTPFMKVMFAEVLSSSPGHDPGQGEPVLFVPVGLEKFASYFLGAEKLSAQELDEVAPAETLTLGQQNVKIRILPVSQVDQQRLNWAVSQFVDSMSKAA